MTDRYDSITVVLDKSMRDDDAEQLLNAIRQLRGVCSVQGNVADPASFIAHSKAKMEIWDKIFEVYKEVKGY